MIPTPEQIADESYAILNAASDTTGNCMTVAAYNVLINPDIHRTLTAELKAAFPNADENLDFLTLEKLPYLVCHSIQVPCNFRTDIKQTGVIKEGLR